MSEQSGEKDSINFLLVLGRHPATTSGFYFEYLLIFEIILCSVASFTAHVTRMLTSEFFLIEVNSYPLLLSIPLIISASAMLAEHPNASTHTFLLFDLEF